MTLVWGKSKIGRSNGRGASRILILLDPKRHYSNRSGTAKKIGRIILCIKNTHTESHGPGRNAGERAVRMRGAVNHRIEKIICLGRANRQECPRTAPQF